MPTIDAREAAERLPELLAETASRGARYVIEQDGRPVAELVPLSAAVGDPPSEGTPPSGTTLEEQEEAWLRSMEQAGILRRPDRSKWIPFDERDLVEIQGKPLSESIVEEREPW